MSRKMKILVIGVVGIVGANYFGGWLGASATEEWRNMTPEEREAELTRISEEKAVRNLAEHPDGKHCLSAFGGEHRELVRLIQADLREPDSYEHISTSIRPVDEEGNHFLVMRYRARNGFGGMGVGRVEATVRNADCSFTITDLASR